MSSQNSSSVFVAEKIMVPMERMLFTSIFTDHRGSIASPRGQPVAGREARFALNYKRRRPKSCLLP